VGARIMNWEYVYYNPTNNKIILVKKCDAFSSKFKYYTIHLGWNKCNDICDVANIKYGITLKDIKSKYQYIGKY
jgi:hypothetical protein